MKDLIEELQRQRPEAIVFYGGTMDLTPAKGIDPDRMTVQGLKREIVIIS